MGIWQRIVSFFIADEPVSNCEMARETTDRIERRIYHRNYYRKNKAKLRARQREYYHKKKAK